MSTKSSDIDESLAQTLEALVTAEPGSLPGLMLLGGQVRRVYFPAIGKQRVVWRKAYCLSKAEAMEEADRFRHAAQNAIDQVSRAMRALEQKITHWTEYLSECAYKCVMKTLHRNPSGLTADKAAKLIRADAGADQHTRPCGLCASVVLGAVRGGEGRWGGRQVK